AQDPRTLADYGSVLGLTFADALDAALGSERPAPPVSPSGAPFTSRHANPFLFATATYRRPSRDYVDMGRRAPSCAPAYSPLEAPANQSCAAKNATTARTQRVLTDAQMRALETLRGLGAVLTADFTVVELRREYRRLVRRVHPDSQPHASRAETERLSRQCAAATDSYQRLLASTDSRH
ncbi:MAG: hypothetical protein ABMA15_27515, partial [Vicinamibacterales bacterium]